MVNLSGSYIVFQSTGSTPSICLPPLCRFRTRFSRCSVQSSNRRRDCVMAHLRCNVPFEGWNIRFFAFIWVWTPVWLQSENAGIDLVAAAAIIKVLVILFAPSLLRIDHTLGWGAWIGAAFMTKYTAPMFLWGPCIVAGIWALRHKRIEKNLRRYRCVWCRGTAMVEYPLETSSGICSSQWECTIGSVDQQDHH